MFLDHDRVLRVAGQLPFEQQSRDRAEGGDTTRTGTGEPPDFDNGTRRMFSVWPDAGAWRAPDPMTLCYETEWRSCGLLRRIKPASSSMAIPVDPSASSQSATFLTWTTGKHLGLGAGMTFDGTGWREETMLTRAAAGRYKLHTVEAALAQVLELETTDCRRSALERGFCPAPASEGGLALVTLRPTTPVR